MIMNEFIENFYEILDDTEKNEINQNTDFKNLDEWDSMTTLMLIAMVDEKYEKQVNGKDIEECETLENLYTRIQSK
jgi:acyl carrier protein